MWLRQEMRGIVLASVCGSNIHVLYPTAHSQGLLPLLLSALPHWRQQENGDSFFKFNRMDVDFRSPGFVWGSEGDTGAENRRIQ